VEPVDLDSPRYFEVGADSSKSASSPLVGEVSELTQAEGDGCHNHGRNQPQLDLSLHTHHSRSSSAAGIPQELKLCNLV
jgi:hypothetical protein